MPDDEGKEIARFHESQTEMNFASPVVDETDGMMPTWALGSDGRTYVVATFGEYAISVFSPDGTLEYIIEREFEHLDRTVEEKEAMRSRFIIRGPVDPKIVVSDYEPDVQNLFPRPDGSLWAQASLLNMPYFGGRTPCISSAMTDSRTLREAMSQGCVPIPGAFNALVGMAIRDAGFDACYVSALIPSRSLPT